MSARRSRARAVAAALIVLGSAVGLAGTAQATAALRPGSAPLVTVEGGQFRPLYGDGEIGEWTDAGDATSMTVEPGDTVEVRGWGATCRTEYLGQVTARDQARLFWHAYCPAPAAAETTARCPATRTAAARCSTRRVRCSGWPQPA